MKDNNTNPVKEQDDFTAFIELFLTTHKSRYSYDSINAVNKHVNILHYSEQMWYLGGGRI